MADDRFSRQYRPGSHDGTDADAWTLVGTSVVIDLSRLVLNHDTQQLNIEVSDQHGQLVASKTFTRPEVAVSSYNKNRGPERIQSPALRVQSTQSRVPNTSEGQRLTIQASSSAGDPISSLRQSRPNKRKRKLSAVENHDPRQTVNDSSSAMKPNVKTLLYHYGSVLKNSAETWSNDPWEFFRMHNIASALEKAGDQALEKALCISEASGGSKNHSKMIQVITAYTYQQEYSGKHMHDSRLKNLRQRGSRFMTLVKAFGHKSVLLLMPCANFVRMKNEELDVLPSKMETQEDFKNLKEQLDRYEKLAQKLIDFVKTVLLEGTIAVRTYNTTDLAQNHSVNPEVLGVTHKSGLNTIPPEIILISEEVSCSRLLQVMFLFNNLPISKSALFRGAESQKIWTEDGKVSEVCIGENGENEAWTTIFSSHASLQSSLERCIEDRSIISSDSQSGEPSFSLNPYWQGKLQESFDPEELFVPGAMLVAHIFPREECLDQSFHRIGKLFLPYVHLVLKHEMLDKSMTLPAHVRESLVEMCLACCRTRSRQKTFLPTLHLMMSHGNLPDHLTLAVTEVQSVVDRAEGRSQESSELIKRTIRNTQYASIRAHCQKGRLLLSLAENSIVCESLQEAESLLSEWEKKSEQATPLEVQVLRMKNTVVGRISRYKGDFKHAAECLETCLKGVQTEAARYHVEYHLADVYCELRNPNAAQRLLEGDVARLKDAEIRVSKPLRRLLLPLAETLILQDRWKEAESELTSLARMFDEVACSDTSDQLGHVRSIIGLARIDFHHRDYDSTIIRTEKALKLVQYYDTFVATSFYSWFLYRFQASTYRRMGKFGKADESLDLSNRYVEIPRHYMTGLGTYVMDLLEFDKLEVAQQYEYQRDAQIY